MECCCKQILGIERIYIHLSGCPTRTEDYEEYNNLPWYLKLITKNPRDIYLEHFKV